MVYDVVDLVSGNIPVDAQAFVAKGAITEERITAFIERMKSKDIIVSITDSGDGRAGSIQMTTPPTDKDTRGLYKMKINGNHPPAVRFVTIAHELAHLFLGHLGEDKKWSIKDRLRCTQTQRELEAETVAFLVAKRNGVESRSETYLANYVRDHPTMDDLDFYQITRAAGQIETLLGIAAHTRFDPPVVVKKPERFDILFG
jgi:deoxycytidylate deaminase